MTTITVTNGNDSGAGSLRDALASAFAGDVINFAAGVTTIDLSSSLIISKKDITIEGAQPGSTTPGVTINGGGNSSSFSDFTINAGASASFDGLVIANGNAAGTTAIYAPGSTGGTGGAAAGGIYDAGALTLTNSVLQNDTATGGSGGVGGKYQGGGAGGSAAGAIYVSATGSLYVNSSDSFTTDSAAGGTGGRGGNGFYKGSYAGGAGGAGGVTGVNGGVGAYGAVGGVSRYAGAGGAPSQPGQAGTGGAGGGGGGGGTAFVVGGAGTISAGPDVVTNQNDDINVVGSLRYELAHASAGDTITFASWVNTIKLSSSLVISQNVTIEGAQPGSTMPGVTINGGGSGGNFSDFTIHAGVAASFDGLIIANGNAIGATGGAGPTIYSYQVGGPGGGAAGGIYDAGILSLTNSVLSNDTATGGHGANGSAAYFAGGAGGSAAGGIYVAAGGNLSLAASDRFINDYAIGGAGGGGPDRPNNDGGNGGAGGIPLINGGLGAPGQAGYGAYGGLGGAPGQPGQPGSPIANQTYNNGPGGGGGGGTAFAAVGGAGTITGSASLVVTNASDDINTAGSLRYELAIARPGDTIVFDPSVTAIDLASTLVIATNVTIEGAQPGSTAPGVTINGGGSGSNFSDFTISRGVSATFDGLVIANGNATGGTGSYIPYTVGGPGNYAVGGIYDAGTLTVTNSIFQNDTATGGDGGRGGKFHGGGAGGVGAAAIYVGVTGSLSLASSDSFIADSAHGGKGGQGGSGSTPKGYHAGGAGGAGGVTGNDGGLGFYGAPGSSYANAGTGGAPGQDGNTGTVGPGGVGPGGGGGGGQAFIVGGLGSINGPVPCYCPGTLITTALGETPVETLEIGDEVMTASGEARPIKWIGRRSYGGRFVMGRKDILPVCIKAGALDENVPRRDLWISPHHAMYFEDASGGVLIEAKDLVNGVSIVQAERVEKVDYYHVELDSHDVIIAEGAPSETYLDEDNRLMFHNAQDYDARNREAGVAPGYYCAPRLEEGFELEAVRQRIAGRAGLPQNAGGEQSCIKVDRRARA